MPAIWIAIGVMAAVAFILAARRYNTLATQPAPNGRSHADREMGELVLSAYGEEWAAELASTPEALGRALRGHDAELLNALDALIGDVTVVFGAGASPRNGATATVTVAYRSGKKHSTAEVQLPWDLIPSQVRSAILTDGTQPLMFTWRPVDHRSSN